MKKNALRSMAAAILLLLNSPVNAQTLISQFDFNNNLNDKLSLSTCTQYNNASSSYTNGAFKWVANTNLGGGGLKINVPDAAFTENVYSIAIDLNFSEVSGGYRKIIDFKDVTDDDGFYYENSLLTLYSGGANQGTSSVAANTFYTILLTRGADDTTRTYLVQNNALVFETKVEDNTAEFVSILIGTDRVLNFFHDDGGSEFCDSGAVRSIRIWNGVVNINNICNSVVSPTAVPNTTICAGNSATINAGGSPDAFTSYTFNPGNTVGASAVVTPSSTATYTITGDYYSTSCNTPTSAITISVSVCTNLNEYAAAKNFNIYPNPNNGNFSVNLNSVSENTTIEIYNSLGQIVLKQTAGLSNSIHLGENPGGLYILKISDSGKTLHYSRIIKE